MTALNKALEWITRTAYLNLLWLGFSLLGLFVFGLFPATAATFAVVRKWLTGETDTPVFKTFKKAYLREFKASNILGYLFAGVGYILYLDFLFLTLAGSGVSWMTVPFFLVTILVLLTALYLLPVFVHYEMKTFQTVKTAFFIMLLNPLTTLIMIAGLFGIILVLWKLQTLLLFFGMSLPAIAVMMPAYRAFEKVNEKQQVYLQNRKA